jgi:hypothetical protein
MQPHCMQAAPPYVVETPGQLKSLQLQYTNYQFLHTYACLVVVPGNGVMCANVRNGCKMAIAFVYACLRPLATVRLYLQA